MSELPSCPKCASTCVYAGSGGKAVKVGTKVRNIRLAPGSDHDIDCRVDGFGQMGLKSEFVKKAT